ncbi:hypothetical protein GZL_08772 [Streptomyces sp. 769]|nr:hypothetical protein GZL_08772 [Streptomyces sp. 769]
MRAHRGHWHEVDTTGSLVQVAMIRVTTGILVPEFSSPDDDGCRDVP